MKTVPLLVSLAILLAPDGRAQENVVGGVEPWLFDGVDGCIAIARGQSLSPGQTILVLLQDAQESSIRVQTIRAASEDKACAHWFESSLPERFTSVAFPESRRGNAFFALVPGANVRLIAGPPVQMPQTATIRWATTLAGRLPAGWRANELLTAGYSYGPSGGHSASEFYVGRPQLNPRGTLPPIRAIRIRRFFMVDDLVLAEEEYGRESGREERVDTEAPQLTFENWSLSDTENTVAFVSRDEGRSWSRLSTNVGFEGINWIVHALTPAFPITSQRYLYTSH
jgi:hypothetical protein